MVGTWNNGWTWTWTGKSSDILQELDYCIPRHTLVLRDSAKDGVQRSDSERLVCWYRDTVMPGIGSFQNDVASHLMHAEVPPAPAKDIS
jgi:hypothetical protein